MGREIILKEAYIECSFDDTRSILSLAQSALGRAKIYDGGEENRLRFEWEDRKGVFGYLIVKA
jgi:hypothetical protein